ncbi:MAG: NADH-quinone oxidoreductase subunit J [Candidatus Omnitrophica bacterium]|nr:NADH-quinone oxidoreductase subunit J [Candidatus Omnitrophota bacterium]
MNHWETVFFYIFSLTAIASSLIVVTNRKPTYGVLALAVAMLALSALFILLKAYFVAVIQVLIYAGAILVLFLFVMMLLGVAGLGSPEEAGQKAAARAKIRKAVSFVLIISFFAELIIIISAFNDAQFARQNFVGAQNFTGTVEAIGEALFARYLFPFELVSGILLIGIFGVVNLAQKELD